MTNLREDLKALVAWTAEDHARAVALDEAGELEKRIGSKSYEEFKTGTGIFRVGITLGEREALHEEARRAARAGASRQKKNSSAADLNLTVREVLRKYGITDGCELDFILAVTPDRQEKLVHARLYKEELQSSQQQCTT